MKKTLLFSFLIAAFGYTQAQGIALTNSSGADISGDTLVYWHAVDTNQFQLDFEHKNLVTVTNSSSDTMLIDLVRTEMLTIPGTGDYFCWGTQCFGEVAQSTRTVWIANDPVLTAPGQTAGGIGFSVYFAHKNKVGEAKYQYEFVDNRNASNKNSIYVRFSISYLTSLDEKALNKSFSVYPNPAENSTTVKFDESLSSGNNQIRMYNLLGEEVQRSNMLGNGQMTLSTEELPAGIYFVNLMSNGKMIASKKLTVR